MLDFGFKQIASQQTIKPEELTNTIYVHGANVSKVSVAPAESFTYPVMKHENSDDFSYEIEFAILYRSAIKSW